MRTPHQANGKPSKSRIVQQQLTPQILESVESAGSATATNFYVKIGFGRTELAALRSLKERFRNRRSRMLPRGTAFWEGLRKPTSASTARRVLLAALAHWDTLEALVQADEQYAANEGFLFTENYTETLVRRNFRLQQPRPDGRTVGARRGSRGQGRRAS